MLAYVHTAAFAAIPETALACTASDHLVTAAGLELAVGDVIYDLPDVLNGGDTNE